MVGLRRDHVDGCSGLEREPHLRVDAQRRQRRRSTLHLGAQQRQSHRYLRKLQAHQLRDHPAPAGHHHHQPPHQQRATPPLHSPSNNLLICNPTCASFTARLTASEGYTWLSTSGTPSAYQVVTTPTLSNFTGEAIGFGASLTFPGTFNLVAGRRYELVATLDATGNSPILLLLDE